ARSPARVKFLGPTEQVANRFVLYAPLEAAEAQREIGAEQAERRTHAFDVCRREAEIDLLTMDAPRLGRARALPLEGNPPLDRSHPPIASDSIFVEARSVGPTRAEVQSDRAAVL